MTDTMTPYAVEAFNVAADSENKIHDDAVASRFGFSGALVPGSAVFGYMAHQPVARWGRDWLTRGTADCRFGHPVYQGATTTVSAHSADSADGVLALQVHSQGQLCATGSAALPPPETPPSVDSFKLSTPPAQRPAANPASLAQGLVLCTLSEATTREQASRWLADLRETDPLYESEQLMHPATLLRLCNAVLVQNVLLGPWIHTGSRIRNFHPMPVGASLSARAVVLRNHEHKGHLIVDLDVLVVIDGKTAAARIEHSAIYLPRQVREAQQA
jgi:acyl dehydratase